MLNLIKRLATYISLWCACNLCPYIYQAQLLHIQQGCSPRYVVLLGDRHVCPKSEWAVAMEQSQVLLNWIDKVHGCIIVEDAASAVLPIPKQQQITFAQKYKSSPELDVCCAAISITNEARLTSMAKSLLATDTTKSMQAKKCIDEDPLTRASMGRVMGELQENSLLFLTLRAARRGITVENVECRHPEVDRTTWSGLKKLLVRLDSNLHDLYAYKDSPVVGDYYKQLTALGYKRRVLDPVSSYMKTMRVLAHPKTPIINLIEMEDQACVGTRTFKDVMRTMALFFKDFQSMYTSCISEVMRLSSSSFYAGAQDILFSIMGAPVVDLNILHALYQNRDKQVVAICAGGYHIESIRPYLETLGYKIVTQVGKHSEFEAMPPIDVKKFIDRMGLFN
jgi:hypothetical protein